MKLALFSDVHGKLTALFVHGEAAGYLRAHDLPRLDCLHDASDSECDSPPKMMLYDIETHQSSAVAAWPTHSSRP